VKKLLQEIRACRVCAENLPEGPRPVLAAHPDSRIVIVGQAPGRKVHASGIPWDDASGDNLRQWLGVDKATFYNPEIFAIVPMGFCFPGTGKSGDLPPRPECAPLWHARLTALMPKVQLTLLIGQYAQHFYLGNQRKATLTETVRNWRSYLPQFLPLPHPSPRNNIWMKKNPWFRDDVLSELQSKINLF
jgi:uracil-DNA glycosylase